MALISLLLLVGGTHVAALSGIASWHGHRGAIMQNVVVLEGGTMARGTFNSRGTFDGKGLEDVSYGLYKNISLCNPIDASKDNTDDLLQDPLGQHLYLDTNYPVYVGGSLFANDHQFITYGGLADRPRVSGVNSLMLIDVYPYPATAPRSHPGVHMNQQLPEGLSDYITNGAYASSADPDQNLGWHFGGMQSASGGEIGLSVSSDTASDHVAFSSPLFFQVDMTDSKNTTFTKLDWPSMLTPRSEGGLVWLPYGEQGVLVAIGGVEVPGDLFLFLPDNATGSANVQGTFMTELAVYDIASKSWYIQNTLETTQQPKQRAAFCTVVAETQDKSSYSIYVYGGYDGTYLSSNPIASDEVWVLSIPSFQWTLVNSGVETHRRQGHVCVSPNPTTMMSIGGATEDNSYLLSDRSIDFFDLNSHTWTSVFDPTSLTKYELNSTITQQIGGSPMGLGDTSLPSGLNSSLNSIFSKKYQGAQKVYQPYSATCGDGSQSNPPPSSTISHGVSKTTIIGAVCGVLGAALVAFIIWRLVKRQNSTRTGATRTEMRQRKVMSWFRKNSTPVDPETEPSHTSTDDTRVPSGADYFGYRNSKIYNPQAVEVEAPSSNVTSPGIYNPSGHGTPYMTSPQFSSSHEVDAERRHEIMDQSSNRESFSIRNHPMYPPSVGGSHIMSVKSESISHPSERMHITRPYGQVSPCELAQDRSNENLSQPADLSLDHDTAGGDRQANIGLLGAYANQVQSPTAMTSSSPISRKPVNSDRRISTPNRSPTESNRPNHHRNTSSMSSNFPTGNFPSPGPDEDQRMSRDIDLLPEHQTSNAHLQAHRRSTAPVHNSIYHEEFDETNGRTWASQ